MTGRSIKQLWEIEGSHMSDNSVVRNGLYGYSGTPLKPYGERSTPPDYCIFSIISKNGTEAGWLFEDNEIDGQRISEKLHDFICGSGKKKLFYRCQNPHIARTNKEKTELHDLLYGYKYNITAEQAKKLRVRMIDIEPCMNFDNTEVFDLTWRNLKSVQKPTSHFIINGQKNAVQGTVQYDDKTIAVYFPEWSEETFSQRYFTTDFDPTLYDVLCELTSIGSWTVKKGALGITLCDGNNGQTRISFGEIIGSFYRDKINLIDPVTSILRNHAKLMGNACATQMVVFDHLTHDKTNNFSWALAQIPEKINKQLRGRDTIRPPYFFLTVYDRALKKYRVKLGVYGFEWERRYLFDDLAYTNPDEDDLYSARYKPGSKPDNSLYVALLEEFKERIGRKNAKAETSYLSYWADPERAYEPGNLLTNMLREPENDYADALEALVGDGIEEAFRDMPVV